MSTIQTTARSVWFPALNTAELHAEDVAPPTDSQVTIRALYSLISRGSEMNFYRGEADAETRSFGPLIGGIAGPQPFPVKFAYQVVGVVETAGAASGFVAGQEVFAVHPHQDRFTLEAGFVTALRPGLTPRAAAFSNMAATAVTALLDVPVRPGECVAVFGLGVIGTLTAVLASRAADRLVLVDPIETRRKRARFIGADAIVHPDEARATIAELSEDRGADVMFEASGSPSALQACLSSAGLEATICVQSYFGTRPVQLVLSPEFHNRRLRLISSQIATIGSGQQVRWTPDRRMAFAMDTLSDIDVDALISHEIPFDRAPEAYELLSLRPDETQGVLLVYPPGG